MKKIIFATIFIFMLTIFISTNKVKASGGDYMSYPEISFEEEDYKLLVEFSDDELEEYYKKVDNKKFSGWNAYFFTKHKKVYYTQGVIFMYKNEGTSASTYNFEFKEEKINKRSFSVTGNLETSLKGEIKKLKAGLDVKLKLDYSESSTKTTRTDWSTKTNVDPGTMLKISIKGEGYIDQGVASKYFFWVRTKKGAFEIFNVGTEYYSMEKVRLRK
ncbi:MAG: hypothetical protein K6E24_03170 [bacterium]|nr:hypothetical protein [bacterium]